MDNPVPNGVCSRVFLRRLARSDLGILDAWENDPRVWNASDLGALDACDRPPFSRETLRQFIENQQFDIRQTRQQRLVICLRDGASNEPVDRSDRFAGRPIGFVDLFDFDPVDLSAGVGILIYDPACRGKGYGSEAVELMCSYAAQTLGLRRLWCRVQNGNNFSTKLFLCNGFVFVDNWVVQGDTVSLERMLLRKKL